jgi:hypothetical protein
MPRISRARHVREQLGVAVGVAGHERADLDARRELRPGPEHGPALEVLAVGVPVQGVEVVPVEDHVDAELFRGHDRAPDVLPLRVLRLQLDADPDRARGLG